MKHILIIPLLFIYALIIGQPKTSKHIHDVNGTIYEIIDRNNVSVISDNWNEWFQVNTPGHTYSFSFEGRVNFGGKMWIDWGDGSDIEERSVTTSAVTITHTYASGNYQQRVLFDNPSNIRLFYSANNYNVGIMPIYLQSFTNIEDIRIQGNLFNDNLNSTEWANYFSNNTSWDVLYIYDNPNLMINIGVWDVSGWSNMRFLQLQNTGAYGNLTSWDFSGWTKIIYIYLYGLDISGNVTSWDFSNSTSIQRIWMYNNLLNGSFASWDLSLCPALRSFRFQNNGIDGSIANIGNESWSLIESFVIVNNEITGLNEYIDTYFTNRTSYTNTPDIDISDNSELLTGTYQQPNQGTYVGDFMDLTEAEITNLASGNDYDGLGTNTPWTNLEKVWVLENMEVSSVSVVLRYGFTITYSTTLSYIGDGIILGDGINLGDS